MHFVRFYIQQAAKANNFARPVPFRSLRSVAVWDHNDHQRLRLTPRRHAGTVRDDCAHRGGGAVAGGVRDRDGQDAHQGVSGGRGITTAKRSELTSRQSREVQETGAERNGRSLRSRGESGSRAERPNVEPSDGERTARVCIARASQVSRCFEAESKTRESWRRGKKGKRLAALRQPAVKVHLLFRETIQRNASVAT